MNGQQRFEYDRVRGPRNESNYEAAAEIDSQRSLPHPIDLSITGAVAAAAAAASACANFALCAAWGGAGLGVNICVDSRNAPKYVIASFLSSRNEPRHQRRLK